MRGSLRAVQEPKGEGMFANLILLIALGAIAYGIYHFFGRSSKPEPTVTAPGAIERTEKDARAGSPAGAAAQQAQEMGTTAAQ